MNGNQWDAYLKSLGVELWPGVAFYLTDVKSRAEAVEWIRGLLVGFESYKMSQEDSTFS